MHVALVHSDSCCQGGAAITDLWGCFDLRGVQNPIDGARQLKWKKKNLQQFCCFWKERVRGNVAHLVEVGPRQTKQSCSLKNPQSLVQVPFTKCFQLQADTLSCTVRLWEVQVGRASPAEQDSQSGKLLSASWACSCAPCPCTVLAPTVPVHEPKAGGCGLAGLRAHTPTAAAPGKELPLAPEGRKQRKLFKVDLRLNFATRPDLEEPWPGAFYSCEFCEFWNRWIWNFPNNTENISHGANDSCNITVKINNWHF